MKRLLALALARLYFRKCRGCDVAEFHTHHLTRLGRAKYAGHRLRPRWRFWAFLSWVMVVMAVVEVVVGVVGHRRYEFVVASVSVVIALLYRGFDRQEQRRRAR